MAIRQTPKFSSKDVDEGVDSQVNNLIVLFGLDINDARVTRRIDAFLELDYDVLSFCFSRRTKKIVDHPRWTNIDLGVTYDQRYFHRAYALAHALPTVRRHRHALQRTKIVYCINQDNAALAHAAMMMAGISRPVVMEIADIQPVFMGEGLLSHIFLWMERWLLNRCLLLVTTSPAFIEHYFIARQSFRGNTFLLENKVSLSSTRKKRHITPTRKPPFRPWVIGYFGALRCEKSWQIIRRLADALPDDVVIYMRGYPTFTDDAALQREVASYANIQFGGRYTYPDDLADIYERVHFNWCFDFSGESGNSSWLLPNRLYEGMLCGVPALALAGTETAKQVAALNAGWEITEPIEERLIAFFKHLSDEGYSHVWNAVDALDSRVYLTSDEYVDLISTTMHLHKPVTKNTTMNKREEI